MMEMIDGSSRLGTDYMSFGESLFAPIALPYTIILILLLAGICVAAFKAKLWVRNLGRCAMGLVAFRILLGFVQLCDCCQRLGVPDYYDGTSAFFAQGLLPVFSVAVIGALSYSLSSFISLAHEKDFSDIGFLRDVLVRMLAENCRKRRMA